MGLTLRDRTNGHDASSPPVLQQRGLIVKSLGASLGMRGLARDFATLLERIGSDIGQEYSVRLPGLGEYEGGLPFSCQSIASAKLTFCLAISNPRVSAVAASERSCSRASRHDRVHLSTGQTGTASGFLRSRITKLANEIWLAIPECTPRPVEF